MQTDYQICKALCDVLLEDALGLWLAAGGAPETSVMILLATERDFVRVLFEATPAATKHERAVESMVAGGAPRHARYKDALSRRSKGTPAYVEGQSAHLSAHARMDLQIRAVRALGVPPPVPVET